VCQETTGTGFVNNTSWATISGLQLRDRKGSPQAGLTMLRFQDALKILENYQSGSLYGPVIIADLKDQNSWPAYLSGVNLVATTLPSPYQRGVVFKMKMKNLPSIAAVQAEASAHPGYGHILPVINPEDATGVATGFPRTIWPKRSTFWSA
jgi:hypothetical protein